MFSKDLSINLRQEEMLDRNRHKKNVDTGNPVRTASKNNSPNHVLYIYAGDTNSHKAMNIAKPLEKNIAIVDVQSLSLEELNSVPWLIGVPTLLCVGEKEVFRGTKCLQKITTMRATIEEPPEEEKPFMQRDGFPPMIPQPQMIRRTKDEADINTLPHFKEPEKESEKEKEDLKQTVEAIMARREQMVGSSN